MKDGYKLNFNEKCIFMKRIGIIPFVLLGLIFGSCQEDDFDYKMAHPGIDEIDSVYFSTGARMLIADGQAQLDFVVEAFRKVPFTLQDGSCRDSMVSIDMASLPENAVKIYETNGEERGTTYSTTDASRGQVGFYAQIGTTRSQVKNVILRPRSVLPEHRYVDVIFHVFELNKSHSSYDPLSYQPVKYEMLVEAVENMNAVFNNRVGHGPNGASANITFRLAACKEDGSELLQPGYNLITYDDEVVENEWGYWDPSHFVKYMDGKNLDDEIVEKPRIWDPKKYLNVVVMPAGADRGIYNELPKWQLEVPGEEPLPGIDSITSDRTKVPLTYEVTCAGVPRTLFFPGYGKKIELYPHIGRFYGLRSTTSAKDWCTDTQLYKGDGQYYSLKKVGRDGEKFLANNAMDDQRYPSLLNNFTLDQVTRMRKVMELCPGRDNGLRE